MSQQMIIDNIFPQSIITLTNVTVENIIRAVHPELWDEYVVEVALKLKSAKEKLYNSPVVGSQLLAEVGNHIEKYQNKSRYKVIIQEDNYDHTRSN